MRNGNHVRHLLVEGLESRRLFAGAVLYVSPTGSDQNTGGSTAPLASLTKALSLATADGTTVHVAAGTYFTNTDGATAKVLANNVSVVGDLDAQGKRAVNVFGSRALSTSGWTNVGANADGSTVYRYAGSFAYFAADQHTIAKLPRNQFYSGTTALKQVASRAAVTAANEFFIDTSSVALTTNQPFDGTGTNALYVSLPSGVTPATAIQAADTKSILSADSKSGLTVSNINFARGTSASIANGLATLTNCDHLTLNNDQFQLSAAAGLVVSDGNTLTISGGDYSYNGQEGFSIHGITNVVVKNITDNYNNTAGAYDIAWEAGGNKFTASSNVTVFNVLAENNKGSGIWFDNGCHGVTLSNSAANFNDIGLHYEVSWDGTLVNNIAAHNRDTGILVASSMHDLVANNTVAYNQQYGINVNVAPRYDNGDPVYDSGGNFLAPKTGVTYELDGTSNTLENNVVAYNESDNVTAGANSKSYTLSAGAKSTAYSYGESAAHEPLPSVAAGQKFPVVSTYNVSDYNCFYFDATNAKYKDVFNTHGVAKAVPTLALWQQASGQDLHSVWADPALQIDYHIKADSPAAKIGTDIAAAATDHLGVARPSGLYDAGAFQITTRPASGGTTQADFAATPAAHTGQFIGPVQLAFLTDPAGPDDASVFDGRLAGRGMMR